VTENRKLPGPDVHSQDLGSAGTSAPEVERSINIFSALLRFSLESSMLTRVFQSENPKNPIKKSGMARFCAVCTGMEKT
jgi:hypothetical protein